jgi:hypothetical protein
LRVDRSAKWKAFAGTKRCPHQAFLQMLL